MSKKMKFTVNVTYSNIQYKGRYDEESLIGINVVSVNSLKLGV